MILILGSRVHDPPNQPSESLDTVVERVRKPVLVYDYDYCTVCGIGRSSKPEVKFVTVEPKCSRSGRQGTSAASLPSRLSDVSCAISARLGASDAEMILLEE